MPYEKLNSIALLFRMRQERNKDILCVTTGEKGDGKSNFTMQACWDYVQRFGLICKACGHEWIYTGIALRINDERRPVIKDSIHEPCPVCASSDVRHPTRFNFRMYMAYDEEEVEEKIFNLPKYAPLIGDEAARWALSEDWNRSANRRIKKLFIQIRTQNLIIFGNIPEFVTLDSKMRNMANYWVRLLQRDLTGALAVFLKRSKGEYADKFHIKEFQEILGNYFEDTPMTEVMKIAEKLKAKHPCVMDQFVIPPFDKDIYAQYEAYRHDKVFTRKSGDLDVDQKEIGKILAYNLLRKDTYAKLMEAEKQNKVDHFTLQVLERIAFLHPVTHEPLVRYTTIRNWANDIEAKLLKDKKPEA